MSSTEQVYDLVFDDENEEKLWSHGLVPSDLLEVLEGPHVVRKNRRDRRGLLLVGGSDSRGRCIIFPVEPTHLPTMWRPITGWICKRSEEHWCP